MKADTNRDREAYWRARGWMTYAVHELPAGVLDGPDAATPDVCREMIEGLEEFERLCTRLGLDDHGAFIEGCRWHFEHYPHYLGRQSHLDGYDRYIQDRKGPTRVAEPPPPPRWLNRS